MRLLLLLVFFPIPFSYFSNVSTTIPTVQHVFKMREDGNSNSLGKPVIQKNCSIPATANNDPAIRSSQRKDYRSKAVSAIPQGEDILWIQKILDNWNYTCLEELKIGVETLPWIIFYDSSSSWHVSSDETMLPASEKTQHTVRFAEKDYELIRVPHTGSIWVPGRAPIPLNLSLSTTIPYANNEKAFFMAPLPSLFHKFATPDQTTYLDFLYLGINIHELTHTRQLPFVVPQLLKIQKAGNLESLDDNTIEKTFSKNERYKELYLGENTHLWRAVFMPERDSCLLEIKEALRLTDLRRQTFFSKENRELLQADEIFLSLEGSAMWAQYRVMLKNAPNPNPKELLLWLVKQGPAWSQERGLLMFLLIDRFDPAWKKTFFGKSLPPATTYLRSLLKR